MGGGKSILPRAADTGQDAANTASWIAKQLYTETDPLRDSFMSEFAGLEEGKMPFGSNWNSMFSAARGPVEDQYGRARENIIATNPTGGRMFENLADVETQKAGTLGGMSAQYLSDFLNKAYGAAWQTPQTSLAGLGSVMNFGAAAMGAGGQGAQAVGSGCCFNFLEAEGEIYSTVRRYRDEHYLRDGKVSLGYVRFAIIFVPLMRKFRWFKKMIRLVMTKPLKSYSMWYYGQNKIGFIFYPFKFFWVNLWRILGVG